MCGTGFEVVATIENRGPSSGGGPSNIRRGENIYRVGVCDDWLGEIIQILPVVSVNVA
jgi:hypothetical protein